MNDSDTTTRDICLPLTARGTQRPVSITLRFVPTAHALDLRCRARHKSNAVVSFYSDRWAHPHNVLLPTEARVVRYLRSRSNGREGIPQHIEEFHGRRHGGVDEKLTRVHGITARSKTDSREGQDVIGKG